MRLSRHIQEEQALDVGGGALLLVAYWTICICEDEVKAIMEPDGDHAKDVVFDIGDADAWPAMCCTEVIQECGLRAQKVAILPRAVAWCVHTCQAVAFTVVVSWPHSTAMGSIWA